MEKNISCYMRKFHFTYITLMLMSLFLQSCGKGDGKSDLNLEIPGIDGPHVSLIEDNISIKLTVHFSPIEVSARFPIPNLEKSYVDISPVPEKEGTLINFSMSLDDLLGTVGLELKKLTLPGGRAVPGVEGGTLSAITFSIQQFNNMVFYIGLHDFGIWVPLPNYNVAKGSVITAPFYSGEKSTGTVSLFGKDENEEHSGFLLLLTINAQERKLLKKLSRRY